jgi:hypothetical protein
VEIQEFLLDASSSSQSKYPIICNITLSYNLGGTLCLPIFAKGNNKRSLIMLEVQNPKNLPKKLPIIIVKIYYIIIFSLLTWILKNNNNY